MCFYISVSIGLSDPELDFKAKTAEINDSAMNKFSAIISSTQKEIKKNTIIKTMLIIVFINDRFIIYNCSFNFR